ncbi:39S mitochondrial ribosomal protein L46 [Ceratobasidium sp. AG-Ba]|nr:39S mitochondrial ribosomal protein L46 [Ceratobasidium sp. AG-Ba]QRW04328.1 39S mitochondrial ribosomal protein L46 [Ceratobasidium sp. AG-Ba]
MASRLASTSRLETARVATSARPCSLLLHNTNTTLASALYTRTLTSSSRASAAASASSSSSSPAQIITSVLLNRSPILTTLPTPFEQAYHNYQARIARALSNPFPREFYFKKGAIAERQFLTEESAREKEAFGEGFGETQLADLEEEDKTGAIGQSEDVAALPREHQSDRTGDVKNLNRRGDRNLYLLVKADEGWRLPQGPAEPGATLHTTALRELHSECGPDMDTWIVGRHPIGLHQPKKPETGTVLFFKAHIFAGQAKPNGKSVKDFAWLTTEEIREKVAPEYWASIQNMLSHH